MSKFKNRYSNEELIQILKDVHNELGRVPNWSDFNNRMPNGSTFTKRFGSWENVLSMINLKKEKHKSTDYTDEYLLNCMIEYYSETSKIPTIRGMKSKGYPSAHAYINHFGSFKNALTITGLFELREDKHQFCDVYTDDELLNLLKDYMRYKDSIPVSDVLKKELSPSSSTYDRRFGSIYNAFRLIGYDIDTQKYERNMALETNMIIKYKNLKKALGRVPSSRDIEEYSRKGEGYSMNAYEFHFGKLYDLQVICGFTPTVIGRNKSKENLLDDLIRIAYELGRTPSQNDLIFFDDVANCHKYSKEFGSWNEAIKLAGLNPNSKIYYSNNGVECLSYYELLFTNMLEKYDIKFLKEEPYNKYINTNRKYRYDYVIDIGNMKYFIEVFGITCREDYKERTQNKIALCKENNLNLVEIYPEDFTSYKLEELHKMFQHKTNYTNVI